MKLAAKVLVFLPLCFSIALASGLTYRQVRGPGTNQDVTVTAQAPPQQQRSYTVFHADSLLNNSKSLPGREFHNDFFDFTYRIPAGWTVEKSEITLKRNKMATVHVKPQGSALTAETLKITSPIILLNATPVDVADRERLGLPCVSISVNPAGPEPLSLETVKKSLQSGESLRQAHAIELLSDPVELTVHGRTFFRKDFKEARDGSVLWNTYFVTSIHGGVLIVNFRANSKEELDQILTTMQTFAFDTSQSTP